MLPRLLTLNNRILELGQEKKKQRKQHYEEKHMKEGVKEGVKEKKASVAKEKRGVGERKKAVKPVETTKPAKPVKAIESTKPTKPVETTKPTKPVKTTEEANATKEAITTKPATTPEPPDANPSGVVGVETAYSVRKNTTKPEDLEAFFKVNGETQEDVGGWDD